MAELLFVFGSAALTIPFYLLSSVPFSGSERIKRSRIYILLIAAAMLRPLVQFAMIFTIGATHGEAHLETWINIYHYLFSILIWLGVLKASYKAHAVKLFYVLLLMRMLLFSINGIAFRIVELFGLGYEHQFELFWIIWTGIFLVMIASVLPFVYRLHKGFLKYELSSLPIKNILLLSLSPVGFYLAAAIYTFVFGILSNDLIAGFIIIMGLCFSLFQLLMIRNTRKLLTMEMQHDYLLDNYKTLESHAKQINEMKHDMRHHLFAIRTLFESGEQEQLAKYLANIQDSFAEIEEPISCSSRLIQAVFTHFAGLARHMDFEIKFEIFPIPPLSIPDTDIMRLFANLLSNAIESCAGISDPSKRWINVKLKARPPYIYLSVVNARQGDIIMVKGGYLSTKSDSASRGHGIEIVQKVTKKHKGFTSFEHSEDSFSAEVALIAN